MKDDKETYTINGDYTHGACVQARQRKTATVYVSSSDARWVCTSKKREVVV